MPRFNILAQRTIDLDFEIDAKDERSAEIIAETLIANERLPKDCISTQSFFAVHEINEVGNFGD